MGLLSNFTAVVYQEVIKKTDVFKVPIVVFRNIQELSWHKRTKKASFFFFLSLKASCHSSLKILHTEEGMLDRTQHFASFYFTNKVGFLRFSLANYRRLWYSCIFIDVNRFADGIFQYK